MRVLITTDTIGGVWTFTQELVVGLLNEGCYVCLVSLGVDPNYGQRLWTEQMKKAWQTHFNYTALHVPLEWMQENQDSYTDAAPRLLAIAKTFNADVIHSNQLCFGALQTSLPRIVTAHSDVLSWAIACRNTPFEGSAWLSQYRRLVTAGLADASTVTVPTLWMLNALSQNFPVSCDTRVIYNGRSVPQTLQVPRKLQAVTAGRIWDEAKNIKLLTTIKSIVPILAAGDSTGETPTSSWSSSIQLLGSLTEKELTQLFYESAIYICASKYEPFGLAPIEAALCGCAVLANDIPSLREVWGNAALYFHDAQSLTDLLERLSQDSDFLKKAQEKSHRHARTFSQKKMTLSYLDVYRSAISQALPTVNANVA